MENMSVDSVQNIQNQSQASICTDMDESLEFKSLFEGLAEGQGKMLRIWLDMEAKQRKLKNKNVRKILRLSKPEYQILMRGGTRVRSLSAGVFARVADWLGIPIVAVLSASGITNVDERREAVNRGIVIDWALDKMARDPVWGKLLPACAYLAEERVKETIARLYQEITGDQVVPDPKDWDQILDEVIGMMLNHGVTVN
jgi:hypothetical protein